MLIYRSDILQALHLQVPHTWPELYAELPTIEAHGMEFYYPGGPAAFLPFLYQFDGTYYKETPDGLRANLTTPQAYLAFKAWTDLFAQWRVPLVANFFTRFQTGEMPMGVVDYPTFVLITVAAPQLAGLWNIAPIPATPYQCTPTGQCMPVSSGPCAFGNPSHPPVLPDGAYCKYNGTSGGLGETTALLIPSRAPHPQAAWKWIEWWTSAPVQLQFANELQAVAGIQVAWNTANVYALPGLQWPANQIKVMQRIWSQFRPQPYVAGGYISNRYINDAWTNVVINGENVRAQLNWAVQNINDEMYRMEVQFGLAKLIKGRNPFAGA